MPNNNSVKEILKNSRCIVHIDLDCFYCQVEQVRLGIPSNIPLAVQQWQGLIAVNYAAREYKVLRHSIPQEAIKLCPEIKLVHVPTYSLEEGKEDYYNQPTMDKFKASLTPYRQASKKIMSILERFAKGKVQKASVDEAYIDITDSVNEKIINHLNENQVEDLNPINWDDKQTIIVYSKNSESYSFTNLNQADDERKYWKLRQLMVGAELVSKIRKCIFDELGYTCSAGIAHNKTLAKIASPLNKPNNQSLLPDCQAYDFIVDIPLIKIPSLGGKLGEIIKEKFGEDINKLRKVPIKDLKQELGEESAQTVYNLIRGISNEVVKPAELTKSMMSAKTFRPYIKDDKSIKNWVNLLCNELLDRLKLDESDKLRWPKSIILSFSQFKDKNFYPQYKTFPMLSYYKVQHDESLFSSHLIQQFESMENVFPCSRIAIQLNGLEPINNDNLNITSFFNKVNALPPIPANMKRKELDRTSNQDKVSRDKFQNTNKSKKFNSESFFKSNIKYKVLADTSIINQNEITNNISISHISETNDHDNESNLKLINTTKHELNKQNNIKDAELCIICNDQIKKEEMALHKDYDYAMDVQKEFDNQGSSLSQLKSNNDIVKTTKKSNDKIKKTSVNKKQKSKGESSESIVVKNQSTLKDFLMKK